MPFDDGFIDHDLADALERRQVVHGLEQHAFHDGAQTARAGLALHGLAGDGAQGVLAELEFGAFHVEQALVLLGQRVLRVLQDGHQRFFVEFLERRDHRQAADELGDQAELDEVLRLDVTEHIGAVRPLFLGAHLGGEADAALLGAVEDHLLEAGEGAAHDEEDVGGVDLQELLLRVLAPALRRHRGHRALDELEQRLLHPLARHVAGDGGVVGLARDLVDLVDVHDAGLRLLDVVVALLEQLLDDVLDVLADIARFGERGGIGDGERDVEQTRERLGEQRLAGAGRADEQDVALGDLDLVLAARAAGGVAAVLQALVVVVDGDREDLLGALLADHIVVEDALDLDRLGELVALALGTGLELLADDVVAELDALVADEHGGTRDELADLMLALAAKGAVQQLAVVAPPAFFVLHAGVIAAFRGTCPRDRRRWPPRRP